ncbi:MAG TPA: cupin domain-containing protein [Streptosporangiaceae bacterium]|nr:cupin domain-containing protein [Streptosporangiaceae bacterium]
MQIVRRDGGEDGPASPPTELRTATFTGTVYGDALLDGTDGAAVTSVFFAPGGRTFWHSHEHGQVLHVLEGRGQVATEGHAPQPIGPGDVIWAPPGEVHWHGGGPGSMVLHLAVSLGRTTWLGPVSDADYGGGQ